MNTLRTLSMMTALGMASAASVQALPAQGDATAQATPPATETQPNTNPVQGAAGATERTADKAREMTGDTKPTDKLVGLTVETPAGEPMGSVVDIVRDKAGIPTHAVVAIDNDTTAVPYDIVSSMVRDGKVIMNEARLAGAPKVKQTEWLDQTSSKWRMESDSYWGTTRTASPGDAPKPTER